ncbi:nuclear cap-binding protein subunit 1-like [Lingula anatina]|uniref:Nuclear cap-binding protein subunit 1 n=1 Tax=Lingula anatina TaxID=7574 RepID=A0A1S3KF50_LINAN|nr:nuclear cap-binding protein subunit 1-like [Lingula anatina]|eukprot:XP_013421265.1 nuclear cap-binding protein subunit 1-like [Lingula anatina]
MSRRRAFSDDSDEEDGRSHKRRRTSGPTDIEDRLESLITRVGEKSTSSLESNLEGLASVLEADLPNYKHKIIKILCECVTDLPEKLSVYTTLVGLLNARNYNCGGEFVEILVRNLKESLKTCQFENARLIVRFLSDLVNCHVIVASSLLAMFDNFVEVTLEDNIPQVRSDWFVFMVLSALPWVGRELFEKKETEFSALLQTIENYLNKRQKIHVTALRVWTSDDPHPQEEYLDCLWAQIKMLKNNKWMERQILRPYLAFDGVLCEALQHTLPQIIPPSHDDDATYPLPSVVFRMFDYTDVPEGPVMPGSHAIERYLVEEHLHRILHTHHLERKDCAAALLSFPTKVQLPLNYMIVEVVFSQLFRLPHPPYLEIFYGSLLIELCKLQPSTMPQVLAQATEMLYERIDTMDTSCIERFVSWFAYHLSNFQFRWSWDDWSTCVEMDHLLPKPMFVKEVLLQCLRLSYHQRILETVPDSFAPLIPTKPHPVYKYEKEGAGSLPGTITAYKLLSSIKSKCTPEEAAMILKDLPNPLSDEEGDPAYNPLKIDVFVSTLLFLGSKSFSHSFAAIAKFHYVFKTLAETEDAQICILRSVHEVWGTHQQMMCVLIDKMLKTQIIECSAVANWLFSSVMTLHFTSFFVWEILHSTIRKMNKHVAKLQKEVEEAKDKLEAAERRARDGMDIDSKDDDVPTEEMIERMEEKLESAQSEQKNLFLIIFQRFIMILTEHLARCEAEGRDYNTPWYKWVIERLQQIFLLHHEQVYKYINTLENLLFTSDIDLHILEVFQHFCALRS